ncbi:MAG TPA: hypothetical protein VFO52_10720 [Longimicrobiales bacterium]|nr:hypothetical protein [Longimicrobiales bacterium]
MSPTKLLNEVLAALARHGPTLIVHLVLLVWISIRVLDPQSLPSGDAAWTAVTERIDAALRAIGLKAERWTIMAAAGLAYLLAFQWLQVALRTLRPFWVYYRPWFEPALFAYAADVLKAEPGDIWKLKKSIHDLTERRTRELREAGQPLPYQWHDDRISTWQTYYGTVLVLLLGSLAWLIAGSDYARSSGRVAELVLLLALGALALRWKIARELTRHEVEMVNWALRQTEAETGNDTHDPLRWSRSRLVQKEAEFARQIEKHPAYKVNAFTARWLPRRIARKVVDRLVLPDWWYPHRDWELLESEAMKFADEEVRPPMALRVDPFVPRFEALLECTGAGLFLLAPFSLGLAPSVAAGGSSYCFATRRHGGAVLAISLEAADDFSWAELSVRSHSDAPAFLVEIGEQPIELLAQRYFDYRDDTNWHDFIRPELSPEIWRQLGLREPVQVKNIRVASRVELRPGSSYLLGARTELGARVSIAFQCWRVMDTAKVLVAWRILSLDAIEPVMPEVPVWWKPPSWNRVLKPRTEKPQVSREPDEPLDAATSQVG